MNAPSQSMPGSVTAAGLTPWLLLVVFWLMAAWLFWPGHAGPELLDDRSSVLKIEGLDERPERALDYVFGDESGSLGRSVSVATFVLEDLYLDEGISGSKKVNIVLHLVNGALVAWVLLLLLRYQSIPGYRTLAVVLGALWLLHPLMVSTVLYAVQRMAMLATLFMLLGIIAYIYWRAALGTRRFAFLRFIPVVLFFVLGIFSKENALLLIPVLLLIEVLWFECRRPDGTLIPWLRNTSYTLIAGGALAVVGLLIYYWDYLDRRMARRPWDLEERLMTQSRVVWDYLAQTFWPQVQRMGLYHDDVVFSRSMSEPVTTLYATVAWGLLVAACLLLLRYQLGRWLVLAISLFLVGHSLESTVWSLELYFEHRNYFPLLGIALLVAVLYAGLARRWPQTGAPLQAFLVLVLIVVAGLTSSQVQIWSKRSLLVLNHVNGHPNSPRANIDMAVELATVGEAEAAHRYSLRAYESSITERLGDYQIRNMALSCMAGAPVPPEVIDTFAEADTRRPLSSVTTLLTLVRMLQDDRCPEFDRVRLADRFKVLYLDDPNVRKGKSNIYANLAVLENVLGRYDNAFAYTERFLTMAPRHKRALLMKLHFATALQRDEDAAEVIAILQGMDARGELTVAQQQTLALYLER